MKQGSNSFNIVSNLRIACFNCRSIVNKTAGVLELIKHNMVDICCLTETWLKVKDKAKIAEIHDFGYKIISAPRAGRGGGVAFIYDPSRLNLLANKVKKYSSFEVLESVIKTQDEIIRLCVIYRCTQAKDKDIYEQTKLVLFYEQFSNYLDGLLQKCRKPIICGDFNIHVEDKLDLVSSSPYIFVYSEK